MISLAEVIIQFVTVVDELSRELLGDTNKRQVGANGTIKCDSPGVDRLGGLPDDVLGRILGFLPTPLAVRATQLSRRWRRLWPAHVLALNLSVQDCKNCGVGVRFPDLCARALARFPMFSIPSISLEFCTRDQIGVGKAKAWYAEAMERAAGSVSVTVLRGAFPLALPRFTRAEALSLTLTHRIDLELPAAGEDPAHFGRLTELVLATLRLPAGTPPLHEFLSSSCPRLRTLRLSCVRGGEAVRALVLRSDALVALDLNNVDGMERLDVAAPNLRSLSVRSCFRFPMSGDEDTEVVVSAPRMESICWYRSYPKRLSTPDGSLARVRRLSGLKLATLGRSDRFDFPYTMQLLQACSLTTQHLELDLVLPDEMTLDNWLGPEERGSCEDLMRYVPPLPRVTVLSLKVRWGVGGDVGPCLASLLSRTPSVATIYVEPDPYCLAVLGGEVVPRGECRWGRCADERSSGSPLGSLREIVVHGLRGTDGEECSLVKVLLGTVPPSIERISLGFHDATAASVVDEIADELRAHFPTATAGCWTRRACPTTLEWTKRKLTPRERKR
ncbi:hypothetical protein CFC21_066820 [Triticum aestivum]|uniref:F-box domain-containing protein n=2 Tax=Triticum aestivum TaxID=4565 RepID=A0A9R1KN03_WHEAT|nr:hypothetical protein CFC21_066820 [Triticum aestivum]